MPSPSVKGVASVVASGGKTLFPADFTTPPATGDLLIFIYTTTSDDTDDGPQASVNLANTFINRAFISPFGSEAAGGYIEVSRRVVQIGENQWSLNGSIYKTFTALVITGFDPAAPINISAAVSNGAASTSQVLPSITTTRSDTLLVGAAITGNTTAAYTSTSPMTNRVYISNTTHSVAVGTQPLSVAGATGTRTFTAGAAGSEWAGVILAINSPAASVTSVTSVRSTSWNVEENVGGSTVAVTNTRSTLWNTGSFTTTTSGLLLALTNTQTIVQNSRSTSWNVEGGLASVTNSRSTLWNAFALVSLSRITTYNVAAFATAERSTSWSVLSLASNVRPTLWNANAATSNQRVALWGVNTALTGFRSTSWNTLGSTPKVVATSYNVLASTTGTRNTVWNVLAPTSNIRLTLWNVGAIATSDRLTTWNVFAITLGESAASDYVYGYRAAVVASYQADILNGYRATAKLRDK